MAIPHASSGELIDVRPLKHALETTITKTLYNSDQLEVIRMVLLAGKEMPLHQVAGSVTVQCLEGAVDFTVGGTSELMRAGSLKCMAGGEAHALKAVEDASLLVTIVLTGARQH